MGCPTCQQETSHVHGVHTPCIDCSTPQCETPQPCTEITDAQCTVYTGANIKCGTDIVIMQNDNVAEALAKVTAYFCNKQGLLTTDDILCGQTVIIPTGTNMQDALELTIAFICQIQLTPGPQGTTGAQGVQGVQGIQGLIGLQGVQGVQGRVGVNGIQGTVGAQGSTGTNGTSGIQGTQGTTGIGLQGTQGVQGPSGVAGGGLISLYNQTSDSIQISYSNSPNYLIGNGVGTLSVPANGFSLGDAYKAVMHGSVTCANNENIRISIMANSNEIASTPSITLPHISDKNFTLDLDFTVRAIGAAGVAEIITGGKLTYAKDANNIFEGVGFTAKNNTVFDTTILNLLQIKVEWQTSDPSNTIQSQMFTLFKTY
jgi:hypothetical protein